jgi:hypothetical protein
MAPIPRAIADGCYELVNVKKPSFRHRFTLQNACFNNAHAPPDSFLMRMISTGSRLQSLIVVEDTLSGIVR